jgi:hypothetical protein
MMTDFGTVATAHVGRLVKQAPQTRSGANAADLVLLPLTADTCQTIGPLSSEDGPKPFRSRSISAHGRTIVGGTNR